MTQLNKSRRRFLGAVGATAAVAAAGCLGSAPGNTAVDEETNVESESSADTSEKAAALADPKPVDVDRIAADPTDVPPPVDWDEPKRHEIELTTSERIAEIEPGVTFRYMTFDDRVPGPMVRVRRGDTVNFTLNNPEDMSMAHNIDFHAVYGPGGGADHTTIGPGETAEFEFSAQYPGVFIYHCAVPNMDQHISAGMFGAILVEPEEGLPEVDRELYFGQHEIYTKGDTGEEGHHEFDFEAMADEDPTYVVFNGEAYAFTKDGYGPVEVEQDETVRVYLANGGPNLMSSWHPIGNVWSRLYRDGDLVSDPARNVETTPVAPGTVTAGELETPVPGPIKIVDHALSRVVRKGALGVIEVDGEPDEDIYDSDP